MPNLEGSPVDLTLGDETFSMSPLNDGDIQELDLWLRSKIIKMARDSLSKDATEPERLITMQAAIAHASTLTWMSGPGARHLATIDGMARLMWQGIKKAHPNTTQAHLRELLMNADNLNTMVDAYDQANEMRGNPKKKKRHKFQSPKGMSAKKKFIDNSR